MLRTLLEGNWHIWREAVAHAGPHLRGEQSQQSSTHTPMEIVMPGRLEPARAADEHKLFCGEVVAEGSPPQIRATSAIAAPSSASPRSPLANEGRRAEPQSPNVGKRPREAAFPAGKSLAGLALERPQRARRGTTRYDPDDSAALPQLMGTAKPTPVAARRAATSRAEGHGSPATKRHLNVEMPPSPRVAAASAVLMGVHAPPSEAGWPPAWSPTRMSPRLVGRSMSNDSVPACDALLLLGVGGSGAPRARPPREWSMGQPRTPLSPCSVASRGGAFAGLAYHAQLEAGLMEQEGCGCGTPGSSSAHHPSGGRSSGGKAAAAAGGAKRGRVVHSPAFKLRLVR
jgi:hypothetical protein